ncbi:MAG: hypothetical protein K6E98_08110 [Lachnospiraceae bacterium]|nr:hypothetical protein [Lachnospiraceae bacterium]
MFKKELVKKSMAMVITGALTIAMSVSVFAAPGGNMGGMRGNPSQGMQSQMPGNSQMQGGGFSQGMQPAGAGPEQEISDTQRPSFENEEMPEISDTERPSFENGEMPEMSDTERSSFENGEMPEMSDTERPSFENGEMPEMSDTERPSFENGEMPEAFGQDQDVKQGKQGNVKEMGPGKDMGKAGMNTEDILSAVSELEDEDVKSNIESLVSAYESAKEALEAAKDDEDADVESLMQAEKDAMEALRTALDEAGIDTKPEFEEGKQQGFGREMGNPGINTEDILNAVSELEDEDVKSNIESLVSAYESAKEALEAAKDDEDADVESLIQAEKDAMEALRTALDEAGIDTKPELEEGNKPEMEEGEKPEFTQGEKPESEAGNMPEVPERSDNTDNDNTQSGIGEDEEMNNLFERFTKWFMSVFSGFNK